MAKILVIEDEALLRGLLKQVLTHLGHQVEEAVNGEEGLSRYREGDIDLVVTDLIMPEKEGLETIQELKRIRPNAKIIAMSGGGRGSGLDYLMLARQLGADQVLAKPFSNQDMVMTVNAVLAGKRKG